ncbi:MAG: S8 family serine peptidase [Desulfobulbaceae bacterium]
MNTPRRMVFGFLFVVLTLLNAAPACPSDAAKLVFNDFVIDMTGEEVIPPETEGLEKGEDKRRKWIVRFTGPVREDEKQQLTDLDCRIDEYIPDFALLVTMRDKARGEVEKLSFVQGVARYRPEHKIRKQTREKLDRSRRLMSPQGPPGESFTRFFVRVDGAVGLPAFLAAVHREKGEILDVGQDIAAVRVSADAISRIAELEEVLWIEEAVDLRLLNDTSRWTIQSYIPEYTKIWDRGIRGQGQVVAIGDTGLDYDMPWFHDPDDNPIGPAHRKVVGYDPLTDDYDGNFGHGTHVACTVAGDRTPVDGLANANGMAPGARLIMQDITPGDQTAVYPPSDLGLLYITPYSAGARLHTNSWGAAVNLYETYARSTDRFLWDHKDFLAFFANGNSGDGAGSVGSPATAKNVVSVGATENGANAENVAPFSSNGPAADGRIKPTVTAPGVAIVSADSDGLKESFNDGTIAYSGTSMATPTVAGAAALVRQYYLDGYWPSGAVNAASGLEPSAALIKATLLNSAQNMTGAYTDGPIPSTGQGWGRINLANSLHFFSDDNYLDIADVGTGLATGASWSQRYFATGDQFFKVTLVWTDYPGMEGAATTLVNDLDLQVITPDGAIYEGNVFSNGISVAGGTADRLNVEEQVFIPTLQSGNYTVRVSGYNIPFGPQPFAVVVTGAVNITSAGFIHLDRVRYNQESTIQVQVADRDLNLNSAAAENAISTFNSTSEPGGETVQLVETGPNTSIFTGSISTRPVPAVIGNGSLEIRDGDTLTATYLDADDGSGTPAHRTATALADLVAPIISGITVGAIGQDSATVSWTTNEPVAAAIRYGEDPENLGLQQGDPWLLTSPVVHLGNLQENATYSFLVSSTDEAGNSSLDDNNGSLHSFSTLSLPPDLTLYSSNMAKTYQTETVLYGTAKDPSGIASLRITGSGLDQSVACRPSDGYYELRVSLVLGDNPFSVTATDPLGNVRILHITVTRLEQPDLTITSVTAPAKGGFSQPIHLENTICNVGPGASPGTGSIAWYLSPDADISPAEDAKLSLEYYYGDEIPPGACISLPVDIRLKVPLSFVGETYYLAGFVDSRGQVWESDETNNIRVASSLIAIEGADLAMTAVSGPAQVYPGTGCSVFNTVRNIGLGTSIPFQVAIYLSTDEVITTDDIKIGSRYINSLEPVGTPYPYPSESSQDTEIFIKDTIPTGTYHIGAIAAPENTFYEPDKLNNILLGNLIQLGDPDTVPPTVPQDLVGVALGYNRAYLNWRAATDIGGTGVAGYRIYRDTVDIGSQSGISYVDTGLIAETAYAYSVAAFDQAGNLSARSATVQVTTGPLPAGTNLPPTISGTPRSSVAANAMYSFAPSASDPNGDPVHFSITNKPGWAGFNETTGELLGIPGEENTGVHGPISITVEDPYGESAALEFTLEVTPASNSGGLGALQGALMLLLKN